MSATITIRMDEKLKKQSEQVFKDMGLNMASDPFYSEANQARLHKAIADLNAGKGKARKLMARWRCSLLHRYNCNFMVLL